MSNPLIEDFPNIKDFDSGKLGFVPSTYSAEDCKICNRRMWVDIGYVTVDCCIKCEESKLKKEVIIGG